MKVWLVAAMLLVAAAYVSADHHGNYQADDAADDHAVPTKCGPLERIKVRRQWSQAFGEGNHRQEFANHLYSNIFKAYPKARDLVKKYRGDNIYSPEFQAFAQRTLNGLSMIIATSDDQPTLDALVADIKARNAERKVPAEYFEHFRDEFLETLPEYLHTHLDWDAWTVCLNELIAALPHA